MSISKDMVNFQALKAAVFSSFLLFLLLAADYSSADFAAGDGSATNPWQIATAEQLDYVRHDLAAHYVLTADIDLTESTGDPSGAFWNGGNGWEPIGATLGSSFTGSIDGNGFKIFGLFADRLGLEQAGLFGWISFGAKLTGLALEAVNVTGDYGVGALVASNFGGTVENSYVSGKVNGIELVGGLVGRNLAGTVQNSYFVGRVNGSQKVGALAGSNWAAIKNNYASGSVSGQFDAGGLTGVSSTQVDNSYWHTEVSDQQSSSDEGTDLSSVEMRQQESFLDFDFNAT
jgi:hypothetical protein